ncbi:MAG: hypothetical protein CM15mP49_38680 [Actinomycetota bacterium]|nr:MAG: hypothetical protein CM15mP49_38680 [Actinomycetota bacterium]
MELLCGHSVFTIRWAETLERLDALGADNLLTEFGPLVEGPEAVSTIIVNCGGVAWLRDQVVDRMNRGMGEVEILHDMQYPAALFDHSWMLPIYGDPEYIVEICFEKRMVGGIGIQHRYTLLIQVKPLQRRVGNYRSSCCDCESYRVT